MAPQLVSVETERYVLVDEHFGCNFLFMKLDLVALDHVIDHILNLHIALLQLELSSFDLSVIQKVLSHL